MAVKAGPEIGTTPPVTAETPTSELSNLIAIGSANASSSNSRYFDRFRFSTPAFTAYRNNNDYVKDFYVHNYVPYDKTNYNTNYTKAYQDLLNGISEINYRAM